MNLVALLEASAADAPGRAALVSRDRRVSYGELYGLAGEMALGLRALGVERGDRVALILPNGPEFVAAYFGILGAGAIVTPMNVLLRPEEIRHVLADSSASLAITAGPYLAGVRAARADLPRPVRCVVVDAPAAGPGGGDLALGEVLAPKASQVAPPVPLGPSDGAACLYTSGTTGRPKGALLTHGNLLANIASFHKVCACDAGDVFLCVLPMFHAFAATVLMLFPLSIRARVVVEPRFVPDQVLRRIAEQRVTIFAGVPSMYAVWAQAPRPALDFGAWRFCVSGGAALPAEVLEGFEAKYGVQIYEGYGPTECAPVLTVNPPLGMRKVGSVGPALPDVDLKVVDPAGREVPPGEVGEIVARGPNVMRGYWNRPAETAEVLRNGWYHTGDLGRVDGDGYYSIVDRKKDLIIVGGLNVYPREVEGVLCAHPAVAEAAVVGEPDSLRGEVPRAVVVLREAADASPQALMQHCRQHLAPFKVPRAVEVVSVLPKTATGKIMKSLIKGRGASGGM